MIPQNKNMRQLVWNLYIDTAVEGSELYCYNTEDDIYLVVSQASPRMDAAAVIHEMSIFTHGEAGYIQPLPHR